MKLPYSWIKEFIHLDMKPHQVAELLTNAGLEVDAFAPLPMGFEGVVVGEVLGTEKHPDAEKLTVATVFDGEHSWQVVCGAPNCRKGMKTAFARLGASLSEGEEKTFKVKKSKLRGVESSGMLCSEQELGLGGNHDGIMEFASHLNPGADIAEIYGDTVFEISLTPNLGHCASVLGVARELSAATGQGISQPEILVPEAGGPVGDSMAVNIRDFAKCPRYACRVIRNVKVGDSPEWLKRRLTSCGMRPVNNVVDITNYVLLECGHPLHAFDLDQIKGRQVIVRCAVDGEAFLTLDGKERTLTADDLLICDADKPIALAGVMGGSNSEVKENSVNILLESAYFEPAGIRRTSKRLQLMTEASRRFERGADPNNVLRALDRAAMLIAELAEGQVCTGTIDEKQHEFLPATATCRLSRANKLLGTQLGLSEVESIFERLEMDSSWDGQDKFTVQIPTYRADVREEIDLIEEIARVYGFGNIPKCKARYSSSRLPHAPIYLFENEIRSRLVAEGLQELLTCDLIGPTMLDTVGTTVMPSEAVVKVMNPTSIELSILRTSLLPGLLQVVKYNVDNENKNLSGFEIGRVHFKEGNQFKEQSVAAIVMTGKARPYHWDVKPSEVDFFDLKGIVENLLGEVKVGAVQFKNNRVSHFHPGRQASIYVDALELGTIGEVHPGIVRRLDVAQKVYFAEIDLHNLFQIKKSEPQMQELPRFPASSRDLTVTLPEAIPVEELLQMIGSIESRLLEKVMLLDIYRSEKLGEGIKNVTFHFSYRNNKKTVAQEAVDAEHARITSQIESRIRR